ncbi:MAG: amidinotransferase [Ignavibacteriales bacterium]|nr:amidinotransferase [Ignavibacteriales bacterium]
MSKARDNDNNFQAQTPAALVMVRPAHYGYNPETASTNSFQKKNTVLSQQEIRLRTRAEFDTMVERLRAENVEIRVTEDRENVVTPNSVFPNNWISFHNDGSVVLYPMFAPSRRIERRRDIIDDLVAAGYRVSRIIDLSHYENRGYYLEGTGSVVFDHIHRCAYANTSVRTNPVVLKELCGTFGYSQIVFRAVDASGHDIYHTNVMMSIGDRFAILCAESITDISERTKVVKSLEAAGREIIYISFDQLDNFAGNVMQVRTTAGKSILVMSARAHQSLSAEQCEAIENYATIVASPIPVIEGIEGGSARCMLAGVHLQKVESDLK